MDRIAQLNALLEAEPDDAFCLYALAQEHAKCGEHAKAIEFYDRAMRADPSAAYAWYHKAKAQAVMGDIAAAIATLHAGLAAAERAGDAHAGSEIASLLDELEATGGTRRP